MRAIFCGSRDFDNYDQIFAVMEGLKEDGLKTIAQGEAQGADMLSGLAAQELGIGVTGYAANWRQHGRAAGIRRNITMFDTEKPDLVVAFKSRPVSKGTDHMLSYAEKKGCDTLVFTDYIE